METIKPVKWNRMKTMKTDNNEKLTAAEMGKLWATYMGNSMSGRVLQYFLHHVDDKDIKRLLEDALQLTQQFDQDIRNIFAQENHPVPAGFTDKDVNLGAPRLFADEFYLYYLKYTGKAGMSVYGIAVPLMLRPDVRDFFTKCLVSTTQLMNDVNSLMLAKGILFKPPYIPIPEKVNFIKKQSYLNGFLGDVRPLHSLEITHLYDNIENNAVSKAVLIGFSQSAKLEQIKQFFVKGREIASKHYETLSKQLHRDDLPSPPLLDHLVTDSTFSPFSDKLMLSHKLDMFAMRVRSYGNAVAFCSRHDLSAMFGRCLLEVGNYAEDGANNMIDLGWMEQPPQAADRDTLARQ